MARLVTLDGGDMCDACDKHLGVAHQPAFVGQGVCTNAMGTLAPATPELPDRAWQRR
jgi:hypothetical protein